MLSRGALAPVILLAALVGERGVSPRPDGPHAVALGLARTRPLGAGPEFRRLIALELGPFVEPHPAYTFPPGV